MRNHPYRLSPLDIALVRDVSSRQIAEREAKEPAAGMADPTPLQQVMSNLVSNAVKFMRGRKIELKLELSPKRRQWLARGEAIDAGLAIDDEQRARLAHLSMRRLLRVSPTSPRSVDASIMAQNLLGSSRSQSTAPCCPPRPAGAPIRPNGP